MDNEFKLYPNSKYVDFTAISQIQLDRLQKKTLVSVEIGAFKGNTVAQLHQRYGNTIQIYPIEACPLNFRYLKRRFKKFKNVKLRNIAISDVDGKEKFYVIKRDPDEKNLSSEANSLYESFLKDKEWAVNYKQIEVPSQTLTTFCENENIDQIDFLKINCEGGEYRIFSRRKLLFLRKVNILDIAIHGKNRQFLNLEFVRKKCHINRRLVDYGFKLICGYNLNDLSYIPINHVRQIWIRKNAPWKK